ncbi:myocardin-related transcription factor B isoform X2 [Betta splendens]|uniref:Myocardin-related transcription factor B isoform X2 n=1 Tax=Betta splendens TaxID=158456 RepID=A0A6P7N3K3_BETSP|nr:myocardin-related transcription factor B isoform X2 [Betta splendens]
MGLQTRPPSAPPLSSMARLDVESPSICRVLQLCLQQRRTREQLAEQGIMPPLKTPAAFHEQIRSLERARTGNFLKHKLCSRPDRSELVRMHILQETQAQPSLQATQMRLKRARLADDLNEKIAQRPGAMELLEKNILRSSPHTDSQKADSSDPRSTSVFEKSKACSENALADVYKFDEDNSDALSPEQPASQGTPGSSGSRESDSSSSQSNSMQLSPPARSRATCDLLPHAPTAEQQQGSSPAHQSAPTAPSVTPAPLLVKQSLHRPSGDKSRGRKGREPKPRMRKLKYHQYIPPDQKQELSEVPMDSAYARLLQQQQQFLQLQILNQQQRQYRRPDALKAEVQTLCSSVLHEDAASSLSKACKLDHLPANLDEMKVAELKMELKLRSLPVSGTKTDLIERLKLYQETSIIHTVVTMETPQPENLKPIPPVSPIASKVSSLGIEDNSVASSPAKLSDAPGSDSPQGHVQEFPRSYEKDSEKDKRLYEKEQQIEELMRKLEREQRLVEELKMQLEVEKRSQQGESPPRLGSSGPVPVKEEARLASCTSGQSGDAVQVKQEEAADRRLLSPLSQCIISRQTAKRPKSGAQLLLPPSTTWRMETAGPASGPENLKGPYKKKDPPPYEDAVKQTHSMLTAGQADAAASQHMDDLFDVLIESGEISPFMRQDPSALDKPLPVTASVTTLPINTVLCRPPPTVQVAQLCVAPISPSRPPAPASSGARPADAEAHSPLVAMEVDFMEQAPSPALSQPGASMDNMDWLELTLSVPGAEVNPLDMSAPVGVFASDFLDSHELHLSWD